MVIPNRLQTQDHLLAFGVSVDTCYFFCIDVAEMVVGTWRQELDWTILKLKGKSLLIAILKLAWNAYLCVIWRQRNKRYFGASFLTEGAIMVHIKELVQARLRGSLINRADPVNASVCASWDIIG
ncbi:hypothetical protein Goshw_030266 [Gossypium schwendimanii]|uniref:Reverse transcriptase zinc-binding domain-containing protein n=1 Tax=Gossypium schwendimanii TaxID=34291 RepID=A0A7J9NEC0_GOSSC|nr:hypothetical protein [Gossypium schwendimanii]